jgi:hypothetical protein
MAEYKYMLGGNGRNQPAVQPNGITASEPDIFKREIIISRRLYNGFVGKKDLLFNKPAPTAT